MASGPKAGVVDGTWRRRDSFCWMLACGELDVTLGWLNLWTGLRPVSLSVAISGVCCLLFTTAALVGGDGVGMRQFCPRTWLCIDYRAAMLIVRTKSTVRVAGWAVHHATQWISPIVAH